MLQTVFHQRLVVKAEQYSAGLTNSSHDVVGVDVEEYNVSLIELEVELSVSNCRAVKVGGYRWICCRCPVAGTK